MYTKDKGRMTEGTGIYRVILADPPWAFRVWSKDTGSGRSAESRYSTMGVEDICTLRVIEAWGFEYKTIAWVWVKAKKTGFGFHMGMGYYTRANTEPCLLATRGRVLRPKDRGVKALIYSPVREHSRKPDEQYEKIARLYPDGPRLEMFARHRHEGWDSWGNEVDGSIEI